MTAIVQDEYGPAPEDGLRLEEVDPPVIGEDEVLVRVHVASVDRGTWHVMAGLPYPVVVPLGWNSMSRLAGRRRKEIR